MRSWRRWLDGDVQGKPKANIYPDSYLGIAPQKFISAISAPNGTCHVEGFKEADYHDSRTVALKSFLLINYFSPSGIKGQSSFYLFFCKSSFTCSNLPS